MSMDGLWYVQMTIDARMAKGLQAIPCTRPEHIQPSRDPKPIKPSTSTTKTAPLTDLKDDASIMSTSTMASDVTLLKEKRQSRKSEKKANKKL